MVKMYGLISLRITFFSFFVSLWLCSAIHSSIITFYIRPYPFAQDPTTAQLQAMLAKPGKVSLRMLRSNSDTKTTEGIFSSYWGYLTASNFNGQLLFPRKQQSDTINILITERITPIFMIGNTIHHWQLDPTSSADLYTFSRTQDEKTKEYYWDISKQPLPENRRIQLDTIVIFARPKDMYIAQGKIPTDANPNLILPPIYAKKTLNSLAPALWIIKMRQFFKPIALETKKITETYYSEQIIP
jgi:hypothetical protein